MEKLKIFAPAVLRIGLALVFLWFGTNQFLDTSSWTAFVPDSIVKLSSLSAVTLVHLNGVFEVVFGAALLLGLFTRFVAFFLALHILDIMFIVGFDSIGVRDFGLSIATIAIWMHGADFLTLDRFIAKPVAE
ncbi:MAG TPA: DoxX family protein [Candidatus Paceibacterota bacterium]|nr:DoxX family protein [Candidatus Paceibacterota bacterium]